ncbi:amino acid permease [Laceyella sacchari]|uniref:Amino acid/polyamine/organocation transporter, APC superfamily n=1 Tax=Laceyella tengchongensis TaxID=574699 RepID=A0AA45WJ75_9BACL|nr:APC family permease [Laceyella tengchongensis]AUS08065.1 amino acid permease [Laceyella sacchari]MRG27074.1 amino acid permease [Laceyella tengchongensis]SMP02237.1 amino acid/polyamine/organocation transporter, APC superfamily [Laceyella tengchongensis]
MVSQFKRILIGKPLRSNELHSQKLSNVKALAILSSDALSSVAYGPEQILIVLAAVGMLAYWYSLPIAVGVLVLLGALILSYRQIIYAYPQGGGAYMVAKENLGKHYGLVAGGSLLIDYILTVSVSVSAGTDAITSAFPALHPHNVVIAVGLVALLTLLNLRGLTESASVLAYPVYLFVLSLMIMIGMGLYQVLTGQAPADARPPLGTPVMGVSMFLILKAFSSGCSALTGVEAISNAIPNFRDPAPKNAAFTLALMGGILATLFAGIVFLAYWYGIVPSKTETVLSQLGTSIFGRNLLYYFLQGTTALILVLAANTGFSAFPLLAYSLAKDKYMPRAFMVRGDRLGYSNGIITLGLASILLIIVFNGHTESLIPLYAVGVFIPFSLSQTGMIVKWVREKPPGWIGKLLVNLSGALICYLILAIFYITKFGQVWMTLVFIPACVYVFHKIYQHYQAVGEQLRVNLAQKITDLDNMDNMVIVPVAGVTTVVKQTLHYAKSLSDNVVAVYVGSSPEAIDRMEKEWNEWQTGVRLVTLHSLYRSVLGPLSEFIDLMKKKAAQTNTRVTVVMPQFITRKWWHSFLHNQSGFLILAYLLKMKSVIVTIVPYQLKQ